LASKKGGGFKLNHNYAFGPATVVGQRTILAQTHPTFINLFIYFYRVGPILMILFWFK